MRVASTILPLILAVLGNEAHVLDLMDKDIVSASVGISGTKLNDTRSAASDSAKPGFSPGTLRVKLVPTEPPIPLAKLSEVEALTKEDFVRSCMVVLGVNDKDLLPTAPLEKLCRTTDHVTECREMIVDRLKQAHNRGEDMESFCDSAYEWFQGKYGKLCANQCDKLQCKASCAWLARKKDYESDQKALEGLEDQAKEDKKQLRSMKVSLDDLSDAVVQNKRVVAQYKVKVERAKNYLAEADKNFKATQADTRKTSQKVEMQEKDLKKNIAYMSKLEDTISKQAFAVDKGGLEQKKLASNDADAEKDLDEAKTRRAKGVEELKANKAKISEIEDGIKEKNKELSDIGKKLDEIHKKFTDFLPKVGAERKRYRDMKRKGASKDELKQQASVYRQQKQKLKDINREKKPFKDERNKVQTLKKRLQDQKKKAEEERQKLQSELKATDNLILDTKAKVSKANEDLESKKKNMEKEKEKLAKLKIDMDAHTDKRKKQEITLKFTKEALDEDQKAEAQEGKNVADKKDDLTSVTKGQLDAEKALKEAEKAKEKQGKALKDAKSEFEEDNKKMLKAGADLKTYRRKLRKSKPEIVAQHKLGLLHQDAGSITSTATTPPKTAAHHHHHHHHKHQQQQNPTSIAATNIATTTTAGTTKIVASTTSTATVLTTTMTTTSSGHHHHHHHHHHNKHKQSEGSTAAFAQVHARGKGQPVFRFS